MVMNEEEVREECGKLTELVAVLLREKTKLENIAHEQSVEIFDYKKMVAGAQNKENNLVKEIEALKYVIATIADIIHMQMPLKYQDEWLTTIKERGLYD
tara:strand:- start:263 stop:559 length:297 start_codon:yes stop_codon:yes gene_type:complete